MTDMIISKGLCSVRLAAHMATSSKGKMCKLTYDNVQTTASNSDNSTAANVTLATKANSTYGFKQKGFKNALNVRGPPWFKYVLHVHGRMSRLRRHVCWPPLGAEWASSAFKALRGVTLCKAMPTLECVKRYKDVIARSVKENLSRTFNPPRSYFTSAMWAQKSILAKGWDLLTLSTLSTFRSFPQGSP